MPSVCAPLFIILFVRIRQNQHIPDFTPQTQLFWIIFNVYDNFAKHSCDFYISGIKNHIQCGIRSFRLQLSTSSTGQRTVHVLANRQFNGEFSMKIDNKIIMRR